MRRSHSRSRLSTDKAMRWSTSAAVSSFAAITSSRRLSSILKLLRRWVSEVVDEERRFASSERRSVSRCSVSYTHLTLPTICSV